MNKYFYTFLQLLSDFINIFVRYIKFEINFKQVKPTFDGPLNTLSLSKYTSQLIQHIFLLFQIY